MITPRLEMILRHINGNSCADIGTDHAYIPIELAKKGIKVIATDIMPGPLKIAAENVRKNDVNIELRLGGGLTPIKQGEVDCIIIAGMGGEMIEKILSEFPEKTEGVKFVLQPMNRQFELRNYLLENGFAILEEDLSMEGFKVYNLIVASTDAKNNGQGIAYNSDIDRHLPQVLYNNPYFTALIDKKKREFTKIHSGLQKSKEANDNEVKKIEQLLLKIKEVERKVKNEGK